MSKDTSHAKNWRNRHHPKASKGHDILHGPVTFQAEGAWSDKEYDEHPNQNSFQQLKTL